MFKKNKNKLENPWKNVEKTQKIWYSRKVTKNSFIYNIGGINMVSVIAHGIRDEKKLKELIKFSETNDVVVENIGQPNMHVKCKDLKIANKLSQKIISLK